MDKAGGRLRYNRSGSWSRIALSSLIETQVVGAYISKRKYGITSESLLDADVPLIGIRHFVIARIDIPIDKNRR